MSGRIQAEVVFFDAVGTLFHLRRPVGEIYLATACKYGFSPSEEVRSAQVTESFRRAFRKGGALAFPGHPAARIPELEASWWRSVVTDTFAPFGGLSRLEDLFGELFEMFRTGHEWVLDRDAETVLRGLRARGMRTGLITNYDSRVRDVLASLGIDGLIDSVTASTLAGFAKPERAIFRTACESLGCRPEEAVHIGDDPEEDLLGAQAAGLSALLYDPNARFERLTTLRIGTLADLFRILV